MKHAGLHTTLDKNHCATSIELALRFLLWMEERGPGVRSREIARHFGVSPATASRWRSNYFSAIGRLPPITRSAATERITAAPAQESSQ